MPQRLLKMVLRAPVYDVAQESPLTYAPRLSTKCANRVHLKREDLQPVFSFKLRGAYNRMLSLSTSEREKGVIAASAGNHAQGVALASQKLGVKAIIVMPQTTPSIKVESVRRLGGEVVLYGDNFNQAADYAQYLVAQTGATFIHPYDDWEVIAGQGTIALELIRQHTDPVKAIFVPVGGGGIIAGVAAVIKAIHPETLIIGVEPEDAACMKAALEAGERVVLSQVGIFADGVAVAQVGERPFLVAQHYVDDMVTVSTDEMCAAIKEVFEDTRSIAEPAGALSVAGLKKYALAQGWQDESLIAIVSGANMNFDRLRYIAERTDIGEGTETLLAVTIPERPGSFLQFCQLLGKKRLITEFNYRYADATHAQVFVGIRLHDGHEEKVTIINELTQAGFATVDLSANEMARLHLRHMIGGAGGKRLDEQLYRFEFPERPGALLSFLSSMSSGWNISLFHYRNHGAAEGTVLAGIQVPEVELTAFTSFLEQLGYPYTAESDNPAYALFLA
jgi:threonine dehydratase